MVDTVTAQHVTGKSILKRRAKNEKKMIGAPDALQNGDGGGAANAPKLHVTFDETITVKNDTDLVVKKPLKLELVIENWKPNNVQTAPEIVTQSNPGKVRRLVDEYNNSIEEPLFDTPKIELTLTNTDNVKEDESMKIIEPDNSLGEAFETVTLATDY